jgi:hypothetical protein
MLMAAQNGDHVRKASELAGTLSVERNHWVGEKSRLEAKLVDTVVEVLDFLK